MNRAIRILLILVIGGLVLWESISWGTRVWTKYKIIKEPLPSITSLIPSSAIQPLIALTLVLMLVFTTISTILRARRLFGLIPLNALSRHVVILGPTGSGKTTIAKRIVEMATKRNVRVTIIDWKGEYVNYARGASIIRKIDNIWDVPGDSAREKALVAVELIREMSKDTVEISPPSSLLLLRVLTEEYERGVPTTEKIVKVLERHAEIAQREGRYAESNMYLALIRRLFVLLVDEEREAENEIVEDSKVIIYDLGGLPSIYLKTLYSGYVLASVYREAMKAGMSDGLKTLLIAEEAQNYIARRPGELPSMAERTVYELRSFGVGVILVCPDPELLPMAVLKDVGAVVSMGPDSLPRFALERFLFRASLEEAEDVLKRMKKAKAIIYYKNRLHFLRRLPKPPKVLKLKPKGPKGDRMGVFDSGVGSLRAWPILPHRSPGRPKVVEVEESAGKPKIVEIKEESMATKPKVVEVVEKSAIREEELRLEEEPEPEEELEPVEETSESSETVGVEGPKPLTDEEETEPEPVPKGPPIPSALPYRGSLCPAGRPHRTPVH